MHDHLYRPEPVAQCPRTGRWFITMGNPGFNSPANNANGYATEAAAMRAYERYSRKGNRLVTV